MKEVLTIKVDKEKVRKNKVLPVNALPEWAMALPEEELEAYIHSPQCRVCNAAHNGRNLRSEIEALTIERGTYTEVCNVLYEHYGLQLYPHNVSRHMKRHAPDYVKVFEKLRKGGLIEIAKEAIGPEDFLAGVLQVSWFNLLSHPEKVSVADGIRAAEKFQAILKEVGLRQSDNKITQEEINKLIDIMQMVMTLEQRDEVLRRFGGFHASKHSPESPPTQEQAPDWIEREWTVVLDGENVELD